MPGFFESLQNTFDDSLKRIDQIKNGVESTVKGAVRVGQTTGTLAKQGLGWMLGDGMPVPARLRTTFEELGATYIKLGQFIASSPSLFPAEYVEEFQKCLDRTDPLPYATIEKILKQELGDDLTRIFQEIEETPLASASIAQVHAARLRTGEDVVLKVQKPGVADVLLTDLNFLYIQAKLLEFFAPGFARTSLSGIVTDVQKTMLEECDFLNEARNIQDFRDFLEKSGLTGEATAPRVHQRYTTLKVLTMERFHGVPLTDLESIRKYTPHPERTLIAALNTWFASLMGCATFHADVHAGNLMVLEDGRVGFIDFGIVGRIRKETWLSMNSLMQAMAAKDFPLMARSLAGIGATDETKAIDFDEFARDLEKLFESLEKIDLPLPDPNLPGGGFADPGNPFAGQEQQMNRLLIDIVELGERNGIRFPREFALLMKQFLYFDRYVQILAPGMDMFGDERLKRLN
ncbi:MAG: AarF/ABC1/UbiB kinase family protein [Leptospirales bacterium]|jgi:aarF domain-containing kinase